MPDPYEIALIILAWGIAMKMVIDFCTGEGGI